MKQVVLDTNFLMIPFQFRVDVIDELKRDGYEPVLLSCVLKELEILSQGRGNDANASRIALQIIENYKLKTINVNEPADISIENYASRNNCAVATNDIKLIKKLRKKHIRILRLRQKKLVVEE